MKKIYSIILVAASLAVAACQPAELDNITPIDKSGNSIKITATIDGVDSETKVTYEVLDKNAGLKPSWDEDVDKILVFTVGETIKKALYSIESVNNGVATFKFESGNKITELPQDTKVYGIYYPGKGIDDIINGELAVDISNQNGTLGDDTPAIMCATATVGNDGSVNFTFVNQTAIVGINKLQVGSGTEGSLGTSQELTKVILSGVITSGTISVGSNGKLQLTGNSSFSEIEATPTSPIKWITSDKGMIDFSESGNLPLSFAVIPTSQQEEPYITAVFTKDATGYTFTNSKAIDKVSFATGRYYYMSKKLDCQGEAVAKVNDKRYATIDAAFAAANISKVDATTITLLKDCTASNQLVLNDDTNTSSIIFDLNGHKLTGPNNDYTINLQGGRNLKITDSGLNGEIYSSANAAVIYVQYSSLTISGGLIKSVDNDKYVVQAIGRESNPSSISITGGKIQSDNYRGVYVGSNCELTISDGEIDSKKESVYSLGTTTINGGKITSNTEVGVYLDDSNANLTISSGEITGYKRCVINSGNAIIGGGTFLATSNAQSGTSVVITNGTSATTNITNGYFSSNSPTVELFTISTNGGTCNVTGGFFDRPVNSNRTRNTDNTACSHTLTNDTKYPYQVGTFTGGYPFVVTVGSGTLTYWHNNLSSAARQAKDASSDVLIKMRASTTSDQTAVNLTNDANNNITLDLAGCTLTTKDAGFITTSNGLTITDSETSNKGKITSDAENIISLTTAGAKITLDGCIIESTANASDSNLDAPILLNYTSTTNRPQLTIENGAQVYTENAVTAIYGKYSQLTLNSCEITSGTKESGRYGVFVTTGLQLDVNDDASIYSTGSSAIYSGSGNAATSIQINGGYIYGTPNALSAGNSGGYSSVFTISGGFFNTDVSTISGSTDAIIYGSIISCTDGSHTPQPTNNELTYDFKCEPAAAKIGTKAYTSLDDAVAAANEYDSNVTITLLKSLTHGASITLNNDNSKEITLDLNGYTLTAGVESFIKGTKYVVTDKKGGGKIISDYNNIIYLVSSNSATLRNCELYSRVDKGESNYTNRAVYGGSTSTKLTIDGAIITATKTTAVYSLGSVTIESTSKVTAALYALYAGATSTKGAAFVIKGGSFRSTGTNCTYIGNSKASIKIEHGYFSTGGASSAVLYGANADCRGQYTIEGGYYSKALHNSIPDYNKVEQLSTPDEIDGITYTHAHTSEINP